MSYALNMPAIRQLIYKDWYLNHKLIASYTLGGVLSLTLLTMGKMQFYMGAVAFITMLIGLSNHQIAKTIINERKDQTLSFVMSLPITPADYALAKLATNLLIFVVPWFICLVASLAMIFSTGLPDGLVPFTTILCTLILLNHCLTWSVGMATESESAVLFVMITLNCLINPFMYVVANTPEIGNYFQHATPVWNTEILSVLSFEIILIFISLFTAVYLHTRKKVFY